MKEILTITIIKVAVKSMILSKKYKYCFKISSCNIISLQLKNSRIPADNQSESMLIQALTWLIVSNKHDQCY